MGKSQCATDPLGGDIPPTYTDRSWFSNCNAHFDINNLRIFHILISRLNRNFPKKSYSQQAPSGFLKQTRFIKHRSLDQAKVLKFSPQNVQFNFSIPIEFELSKFCFDAFSNLIDECTCFWMIVVINTRINIPFPMVKGLEGALITVCYILVVMFTRLRLKLRIQLIRIKNCSPLD